MKNINIKLFSLLLLITMIIPLALIGCDESGQTSEVSSTSESTANNTSEQTTSEQTTSEQTTSEQTTTEETTTEQTSTDTQIDIETRIKLTYLEKLTNEGIKNDYGENLTINDVSIINIFGIFGDNVAVMMDCNFIQYHAVITEVNVADIIIRYSDSNSIKVLNSDNFYTLQEAYEQGLLTVENIEIIAQKHKTLYPSVYGIID